jgi:hypothetical protein
MTGDDVQAWHLIGRARAAIACSRELTRLVGRSLQRSLDLHIASEQRLADSRGRLLELRLTLNAHLPAGRFRHPLLSA